MTLRIRADVVGPVSLLTVELASAFATEFTGHDSRFMTAEWVRAFQLVFIMASHDANQPTDDASTDQALTNTIDEGIAIGFKPTGSSRRRYRIAPRDDAPGWWLLEETWVAHSWQLVNREPALDVTVRTGNPPE